MKIHGLEGLTVNDLNRELEMGGKFVIYHYCISILVATFRRSSEIYFIPARQKGVSRGMMFTLLTFIFGWWGIPWGPIYSISSLVVNLSGGKNVTKEVIQSLNVSSVTE